MQTTTLRDLVSYRREAGPRARFASVYYDSSHDTEDAAKVRELTCREIREQLERAGADAATIDVVGDRVMEAEPPAGKGGRALIAAADGRILLDYELAEPPPATVARWSDLPYLVPVVRYGATPVPHVITRVDKVGAEVVSVGPDGRVVDKHTVLGAQHPVHEAGTIAGLPRAHDREHVQETVKQNITKVADEVTTAAEKVDAELIVISGEIKGRRALRGSLPDRLQQRAEDVRAGGREQDWHDNTLDAEVDALVRDRRHRHTEAVVDRFRAEAGRGENGRTVEGLRDVCTALRDANMAALLIGDVTEGSVYAGGDPIELAADAGVLDAFGITTLGARRIDEAVPFAAVAVGAELVGASGLELRDGLGALIRYG